MKSEEINYDKSSVITYWLLCLLFMAITVYLLIFHNEFFWIPMPFAVTYFALGLRAI